MYSKRVIVVKINPFTAMQDSNALFRNDVRLAVYYPLHNNC